MFSTIISMVFKDMFEIRDAIFYGRHIETLVDPPAGPEMVTHISFDASQFMLEPVHGHIKKPGGIPEEIQLAAESVDISDLEFIIEKGELFKVGTVGHLA